MKDHAGPRHSLKHSVTLFFTGICFVVLFFAGHAPNVLAEGERVEAPSRFGMSAKVGRSFSPNSEMTFVNLTGIYSMDLQRIWPARVPDNLRIKAEFSPGVITHPDTRAMISAQALLQIYFNSLATSTFKPYLEFGAGGIYLDYRVEGQGSRFNFLLVGGPGIEFISGPLKNYFTAFRYHHVSNGGLAHGNKAIDSLTFSIGYYF